MKNRLRITVLERDGYRCAYCGKRVPEARLQVDHFIPRKLGGEDRIDNLVTACQQCNNGKSAALGIVPDHLMSVLSPGPCWTGCRRPPEAFVERSGKLIPCCHDHYIDGPSISTMGMGYYQ